MTMTTRRQFLGAAAGSLLTAASAHAIQPFARKGKPVAKLSVAAYSMRDYLDAKPGSKGAMDLLGFIDYCATLGVDGVELTSYYFPKEITLEYLIAVKRRSFVQGLDISGGAIGNDYCQPPGAKLDADLAHTKKWIDYYADLGAPVIRVFAGSPAKGESEQTAVDRCIENCVSACDLAGKRGVMLALENHGGITTKADTMLEIVKGVKSEWFGVNFDSGNFRSADPYAELAKIAPYAINAQIKVSIGAKHQKADFPRILSILKTAGYTGWIVLEYEEKQDPYTGVPAALAELRKALEGY